MSRAMMGAIGYHLPRHAVPWGIVFRVWGGRRP